MSFNQVMQPYERKDFLAEGDFLYVEECPSSVVIYAQRGQYTLKKGAQVKSDTIAGRITIENRGEAGAVSVVVGFGEYVAPQKDSIEVSNMPPVELADGQQIEVSNMPPVELADGQQIEVSNIPQKSALFNSGELSTPATFPLNADRNQLIIKASDENINAVNIGAFSLSAGERIELNTTAEITVSGDECKIQYIEV